MNKYISALILATLTGTEAYAQSLQVAPRLVLDLMDLCLYFYDKRLTPSRYKGVY